MILLERDGLIDRLNRLLDGCASGAGRVALLTGEAGVGKTSVVDAFALSAGQGARVLRGACEDLSTPDPLGPLYDLARDAQWDMVRLEQNAPRLALFSAALEAFETPGQATIVIIEDLHWADDATLDFVRFLGRRIGRSHILLVVTGRHDAAKGRRRLRRAISEVPSETVARIEVPLLSEAAVRRLAAMAGKAPDAIYQVTAGNAFFVTELLQADASGGLPETVRDAVLVRAERLSAAARDALDAVSVFSRYAETAVLEQMLGPSTARDLGECLSAGLLCAVGDSFAFRHEVARRAVESALSEPARCALNRQALRALQRSDGVAVARLVHHAVAACDVAVVRELAMAAADEAAQLGAHHEAASHLQAAFDVMDGSDPAARAMVLERLAFEYHLIGRMSDALAAVEQARRIHAVLGDAVREGDCLRWLSRYSYLAGDRRGADAFGAEALRLLETQPADVELAMAYSNRAQLAMLADLPDEALLFGRRAIKLAVRFGRTDIRCHAENNVGTAMQWTDAAEARKHLATSLETALALKLEEHAARAYTNLGCIEMNLLDYGRADAFLRAGIDYCAERDLDTWRDYMRGWLAELLLRRGQWDAAAETARMVLDNEQAAPLARYPAGMALARLRLRRGDPIGLLFGELTQFLDRGKEFQRLTPFAALMAERAWLGGDDAGAALQLVDEAMAMTPARVTRDDLPLWRGLLTGKAPPDFPIAPDAPYERGLRLLFGDADEQQEALAIFTKLGAHAVVRHATCILRSNGVSVPRGPYRSARENRAGLTARQMDVLRLVGRGLSNKAIANALAISPKTVDHHVSAIIGKLAVGSRNEAALLARERGLI